MNEGVILFDNEMQRFAVVMDSDSQFHFILQRKFPPPENAPPHTILTRNEVTAIADKIKAAAQNPGTKQKIAPLKFVPPEAPPSDAPPPAARQRPTRR